MTTTLAVDLANILCDDLMDNGFGPFYGTPCGILAPLYDVLEKRAGLITVSREDNAVGMAAGASLAGRYPAVVMQNSGFGQSVNALASLVVPYRLPMLLVISLRGVHPDSTQENQVMGRLTEPLLRGLGIESVTPSDLPIGRRRPVALLVPPSAFGWSA
ncbi:thiamine pyrophosphate-binding protein [Kibdelosporangium persicum]|uniref:Phosphonopyruvate decarboxylase alpha subunit n=1 Tax=Kibdelosporangium persicum TaxID=2698649 RepID=A0ABX2FHU6_9PSEU|nr:thiamine pyrophosphate-binding protein [Kibdelosporangium persicum]NRN70991.1 Phosphonopyruvate decarboxylase alpha subunit [Kibdelosporangium persicum]